MTRHDQYQNWHLMTAEGTIGAPTSYLTRAVNLSSQVW
jgi:hypothetical protein